MKVVVATFNQEKALVGAFSVIIQLHWLIVYSTDCFRSLTYLLSPPRIMRGIQLLCIRVPSYAELQLSGPGAHLLIFTSQLSLWSPIRQSQHCNIVNCHRSALLVIFKVTIALVATPRQRKWTISKNFCRRSKLGKMGKFRQRSGKNQHKYA